METIECPLTDLSNWSSDPFHSRCTIHYCSARIPTSEALCCSSRWFQRPPRRGTRLHKVIFARDKNKINKQLKNTLLYENKQSKLTSARRCSLLKFPLFDMVFYSLFCLLCLFWHKLKGYFRSENESIVKFCPVGNKPKREKLLWLRWWELFGYSLVHLKIKVEKLGCWSCQRNKCAIVLVSNYKLGSQRSFWKQITPQLCYQQ